MDLTQIKKSILNQLTNTDSLYSLKVQNHIYGCFIVMEDIVQELVDLSGTTISTPKFIFDLDKQFSDIGIQYGFTMNPKLSLDIFNQDYKEIWLQYFKDIDISRNIIDTDNIEDSIIEIVQNHVKPNDSFFIQSLETGSLSQQWIEKVFALINSEVQIDEEILNTALTKAISEKPFINRRRLATTRRVKVKISINKKALAKTRRHK